MRGNMLRGNHWSALIVIALLGTSFFAASAQESNPNGSANDPSKQHEPPPKPSPTQPNPSERVQAPLPPAAPNLNAPHTPLGEAMVAERTGDCDTAILKYQRLIADLPKSPDAYAV